MIRKIYMIEKINAHGELKARRFARNLKTAKKIAKQLDNTNDVYITLLKPYQHRYINYEWIEG